MKNQYFIYRLVVILVLCGVMSSITISYAQQAQTPMPKPTATPTPSPREVLVSEIRGLAKRHVENDTELKTELAIDLYKNNPVGMPSNEIAKIYDEEYTRLKKLRKPTLWEQYQPKKEWIPLVIGFLLGALVLVIKDWLTKLFKAIGERFYKKFAGRRVFRGKALRRYQKALFDKYGKLVIPFRPNRPLDMQKVYVPLKVAGTKESDQIEAQSAITQHRRLMVVGQPGSGKSMLCKNLMFAYSEKRLNLPDAPIPILLELHRLSGSTETIENHLVKEFDRNDFPHAEYFVSQSLKNGKLMLLLDGLDEVSCDERNRVVRGIKDLLDKYRNCRVLITCRTAVYKNEFAEIAEQTLEIVDFNDQQIRRFLQSWEKDMPPEKSIEQLMHTLRDRPRILSLARNPLLLTIVAYLYTDTPYVLPHSRAEFYRKATDQLLNEWHTERNRFEFRDKKAILQHLALFNQDMGTHHKEDRRSIAYKTVVEQVRRVLPHINLKAEQVDDILDEIVERSGLLMAIDGGERYQFAHLTLQEFLAAEELLNDAQGLIDRFCKNPDAWRETVKLWSGLALDSTSLIRTIYNEDSVTAFECLADAKKVEPTLVDKIIDDFKEQLRQTGERLRAGLAVAGLGTAGLMRSGASEINYEEDVIIRAFGAVASDSRPRGKVVFEFLQNMLETSTQKDPFLAAAYALSFTNLPQAAKVLAQYYTDKPEVREPLIRMGDIAVPVLKPLAEAGSTEAMDDLQAIGTPQAAEALVPLLWRSEETAYKSAWRLAALLPLPNVENVLRNYPLTDEQKKAGWIDWIWKPFNEPRNSALPLTTGRIAYLLQHAPIEMAPEKPPIFDPRLIIPLSVIGKEIKISDKLKITEKNFLQEDENIQKKIVASILNEPTFNQREQYLLSGLETKFQIKLFTPLDRKRKLLTLLDRRRKATQNDWVNIFNPVEYDFAKSWHFRTILGITTVISVIFVISFLFNIWNSSQLVSWSNALSLLGLITFFTFWGFLIWHKEHDRTETLVLGFIFATIIPFSFLSGKVREELFRYLLRLGRGMTFQDYIIRLMFTIGSVVIFVIAYMSVLIGGSYFSIKMITGMASLSLSILTWLFLNGIGVLLVALANYHEDLAQNPLHGILEPPSGKIDFVPSSFSKR